MKRGISLNWYLITCVVWAIAAIICSMITRHDTIKMLYPTSGIVIKVNRAEDFITIEDYTGNIWKWSGAEDWTVGDYCALIMNDKGTTQINDDEIISIRYTGYEE